MAQALPIEDLQMIEARTAALWQELQGQSLFLTGGTGFFGSWLLESLQYANRVGKLGVRVAVLTRNPEAFREARPHLTQDPSIRLLSGDVRSFAFPEGEFTYVIHGATETCARPGSGGTAELLGTILGGTERVLQFASMHGTRRLLFASSGAIYGPQPQELTHIGEDYQGAPDPLRPESAYGEGKRAAEALCVAYGQQYGFACSLARCFAFVGPLLALDQHFAIGNFLRDALRGKEITIRGDGTARRSYMYAADLAVWLWTLLVRAPHAVAYNVGSGDSVSILELANLVRRAIGSTAEVRVTQQAIPGAQVHQYVPSVRKAEQELGLKGQVPLSDAICRTAAWHGWKS
jgi:dTDP-glucose 4,6-dehydratase